MGIVAEQEEVWNKPRSPRKPTVTPSSISGGGKRVAAPKVTWKEGRGGNHRVEETSRWAAKQFHERNNSGCVTKRVRIEQNWGFNGCHNTIYKAHFRQRSGLLYCTTLGDSGAESFLCLPKHLWRSFAASNPQPRAGLVLIS